MCVCVCVRACVCVCGALVGGAGEVEQLDRVGEGRAELCVCVRARVCITLVSEGRAELERRGPKARERASP